MLLFEKYAEIEVKNNQNIIFNVTGSQINIANNNGKVEARQYRNNEKSKTKVIVIKDTNFEKQTSKDSSATSSNSGYETIILAGIILLILTRTYLNYHLQVKLGLVITSIGIEMITCLVYYNGKKVGIIYGENIKEISYFNMISIIFVPILIGIGSSPIYTTKVNFDILIQAIKSQNLIIAFLILNLVIMQYFKWLECYFLYCL